MKRDITLYILIVGFSLCIVLTNIWNISMRNKLAERIELLERVCINDNNILST